MLPYIHPDQAGFIPGRQLRDSIWRVRNIIRYIQDRKPVALLYFIYAEKAFGQMDWVYLQGVEKDVV